MQRTKWNPTSFLSHCAMPDILRHAHRRTQCERLLGRETAALHSIAAPTSCRSTASAPALSSDSNGEAKAGIPEQRSRKLSGGSTDADKGRFWSRVYRSGIEMDGCYYLQGASDRFATTIQEVLNPSLGTNAVVACMHTAGVYNASGVSLRTSLPNRLQGVSMWPGHACNPKGGLHADLHADGVTQDLVDKLARAGHTATPAGGKLVVAGGILRSGALTMDALVIDPARLTISRSAQMQLRNRK